MLKLLDIEPLKGWDDYATYRIQCAITKLRHSLCHNYGLAIKDKKKGNKDESFLFVLDFSDSNQAIRFPIIPWNGVWGNKNDEMQTTVFVFPLCNAI